MLPRGQVSKADEQQLKARLSAVEWSLSPRVWRSVPHFLRNQVPSCAGPALTCSIRKESKDIRLVSMSQKRTSERASISNLVSGSIAGHALPLAKR